MLAGHTFWHPLFIIVYFLQVFGLLSHPVVGIMYMLEQISIHLFGTTPRSSDSRIVMSAVMNAVFILVINILRVEVGEEAYVLSMVGLSFLASHNILASLGIKKPF